MKQKDTKIQVWYTLNSVRNQQIDNISVGRQCVFKQIYNAKISTSEYGEVWS